ncbi:MAG: hypothetical protein HC875_41415, partial [Anaerolineales bacterium]|nr:hypothetical protein [Anaerolineales bacterium]
MSCQTNLKKSAGAARRNGITGQALTGGQLTRIGLAPAGQQPPLLAVRGDGNIGATSFSLTGRPGSLARSGRKMAACGLRPVRRCGCSVMPIEPGSAYKYRGYAASGSHRRPLFPGSNRQKYSPGHPKKRKVKSGIKSAQGDTNG